MRTVGNWWEGKSDDEIRAYYKAEEERSYEEYRGDRETTVASEDDRTIVDATYCDRTADARTVVVADAILAVLATFERGRSRLVETARGLMSCGWTMDDSNVRPSPESLGDCLGIKRESAISRLESFRRTVETQEFRYALTQYLADRAGQ